MTYIIIGEIRVRGGDKVHLDDEVEAPTKAVAIQEFKKRHPIVRKVLGVFSSVDDIDFPDPYDESPYGASANSQGGTNGTN